MGEQAPFYIFTAFVFTYGTTTLGVSRDLLLTAVLDGVRRLVLHRCRSSAICRIGSAAGAMYMLGAVATGVFGFVYFALLNTGVPALDLPRHRAVAGPARHDVRPAGGADRRVLHRPAALQRRLASAISWPRSSPAAPRR